jgi:hypothetical protein
MSSKRTERRAREVVERKAARRSGVRRYGPHVAPPAGLSPILRRTFEKALQLLEQVRRPADLASVIFMCTAHDPRVDSDKVTACGARADFCIRGAGYLAMMVSAHAFLDALRRGGEPHVAAAIERCSGQDRLAVVALDGREDFYVAPVVFPLLSPGGQA